MNDRPGHAPLPGAELVEVAYADEPAEAEMIQGLLASNEISSVLQPTGLNISRIGGVGGLGSGYGDRGSQRVMVHADQAEQARVLLDETMVESEEEAWPEIANTRHLEGGDGRKSRGYGLVGAYARIYIFSLGAVVVAFGIFILLRAS